MSDMTPMDMRLEKAIQDQLRLLGADGRGVRVENMSNHAGLEVSLQARGLGLPVRVVTARIVVPYDRCVGIVFDSTVERTAVELYGLLNNRGALEPSTTPLMGPGI